MLTDIRELVTRDRSVLVMSQAKRSTKIAHGRLAMRDSRLAAARAGAQGLRIMTFEQAAVRLAGGFAQPIDSEALRTAVQKALPTVDMGELESIKLLPGMVAASVDTLRKVWYAGINIDARANDDPRLAAIAHLEAAVLAILPRGMRRPADIVAAATARLPNAPAVLGAVEVVGLTELEPCWRVMLTQLATRVPVQWTAGPRSVIFPPSSVRQVC